MANWDKNKTICPWCAGEIFIFLTPGMFWLMLGPPLNLMRTTGTSAWRQRSGDAEVDSGSVAKYNRSEQSDLRAAKAHDKRWPLCFKAHIHILTYTYKPTSFPYRQSSLHPSFEPAMRPAENKFSFPPRWAGAQRHAPLLLVNTSSGPSAPWSKRGVGSGKLTDRGYN